MLPEFAALVSCFTYVYRF